MLFDQEPSQEVNQEQSQNQNAFPIIAASTLNLTVRDTITPGAATRNATTRNVTKRDATTRNAHFSYTRLQEVRKSHSRRELRDVHLETLSAVENLKRCESSVIKMLQECDRLLVHRFLGYRSLFQYAVEALRLSESQAYDFISVARKAAELPVLMEAIKSGEVTVSKARRVTAVIDEQNQDSWLHLLRTAPKREIERAVAEANPQPAVPERVKFLNQTELQFMTTLNEQTLQKLKTVQDLISQARGEVVSLSQVIEVLAADYLERKDPVTKAKRALAREEKRRALASEQQKCALAQGEKIRT